MEVESDRRPKSGRPRAERSGSRPAAGSSGPAATGTATRPPRRVPDQHVHGAFEPDVFGGPEAEPEPEFGDFCFFPGCSDGEGIWL